MLRPRVSIAVYAMAGLCLFAQVARAGEPALLPLPQKVKAEKGSFALRVGTPLVVPVGDVGARNAAARFAEFMLRTSGLSFSVTERDAPDSIRFVRAKGLAKEGYRLDVRPGGAVIAASTDVGLFYGGVTLWQLATQPDGGAIPAIRIEDAPRFTWRGLMLDSARHFQSPEFVKQLIDWMAAHKLNVLHWHLVDDQGWRIEIRKYPKLTEIGGWRTPASAPGAPALPRTGGFYSQDQIRVIVAYAAARGITVVPEIEMPGHALSAIRAYPKLGTGVVPAAGIESDWGVFPYLYNIDDSTFGFLQDVLDEVVALFPAAYIHVGGDEAVKDQWQASPRIQAQMKALGVANEKALQSWFIHRIGRYLSDHGRKLIGWDEILDGGLAPNATVMSWRGIDGAVAAARAGHDAVLAPAPILYLDHRQGLGPNEPPGRGAPVTLGDIYAFDPSPDTLRRAQQRHILGLQANLWTEHVRTEGRAAYMIFPRASALAELGWSRPRKRNLLDFIDRLVPQLDRLKPLGLTAAASAFAPLAASRFDPASGKAEVTLSNQIGAEIRYTLDGSEPVAGSVRYSGPLALALPTRLRAASFREGKALPGALDRQFDARNVHRRDDTQLKLCTERLVLQLDDDAPAAGSRAAFLTDIMNPCWIYEGAPMDGVTGIALDVGMIPFTFQIGADVEKIRFRPPATPEGEFEVRIDGCEGDRIAVLPLAQATRNPAVTTIRAGLPPRRGRHDLCITYTARGPDPMWGLDAVQLVAGR